MKTLVRSALIAILFFCGWIPLSSFAIGAAYPGYVSVYNSGNNITGTFNVRYNPNVTQGYIQLSMSAAGQILVAGQDSQTGTGFSCYVNKTDSVYPTFQQALQVGMTNGATVNVQRSGTSCTTIGWSTNSAYQN